jgi:hypothetical protein
LLDIPFFVGNPDIVTHTLTIDPVIFGLDPLWHVVLFHINPGDPPPDSLGPGESMLLHLGFMGSGAEGARAPTAPFTLFGDSPRVEVSIQLDGIQVGGFTVELNSGLNYLPLTIR